MDPAFLKLVREELEARYSIDLLSRSFIFDKKYAAERNQPVINSVYGQRRTTLSLVLHELMDDKSRVKIFKGRFDLGGRSVVARADCTYIALANDLYLIDSRADVNELFRSVKQGIKRLTGKSVAEFWKIDPLAAMKVVKLLYLISKTRCRSIFSILSHPEKGSAGLEFREAYPNGKNNELIWLVSDIREYLAADLTRERMMEIRAIFATLLPKIADMLIEIDFVTRKVCGETRADIARTIRAYEFMMMAIADFRFDFSEEEVYRLDETLFIYISSLEFRHYAAKAKAILDVGMPQISVFAIGSQLRNFVQTMPRHSAMYGTVYSLKGPQPHECKFYVEDVLSFAHMHSAQLRLLIESALSITVPDAAFRKSMADVRRLLELAVMSDPRIVKGEEKPLVDVTLILAAFCAVQAEHLNRTWYEPHWHGKPRTGGSLSNSLKSEFSDNLVYEEHSQIWRIRLYLFYNAIDNNLELGVCKEQLKIVVFEKIVELVRFPNTKNISKQLAQFFNWVHELSH